MRAIRVFFFLLVPDRICRWRNDPAVASLKDRSICTLHLKPRSDQCGTFTNQRTTTTGLACWQIASGSRTSQQILEFLEEKQQINRTRKELADLPVFKQN
jgi:hypothetical protein